MRRKSLFGKVGVLALTVALTAGTTGMAYGMWAQSVNINVSSTTGALTWALAALPPTPTGGSITDSVNGNVITVVINNPSGSHNYTVPFILTNSGTIPVKIQSIIFSVPPGVTPVMAGLAKGDQLDPAGVKQGQVSITDTATGIVTFTVTIQPVQWNLYVP